MISLKKLSQGIRLTYLSLNLSISKYTFSFRFRVQQEIILSNTIFNVFFHFFFICICLGFMYGKSTKFILIFLIWSQYICLPLHCGDAQDPGWTRVEHEVDITIQLASEIVKRPPACKHDTFHEISLHYIKVRNINFLPR